MKTIWWRALEMHLGRDSDVSIHVKKWKLQITYLPNSDSYLFFGQILQFFDNRQRDMAQSFRRDRHVINQLFS